MRYFISCGRAIVNSSLLKLLLALPAGFILTIATSPDVLAQQTQEGEIISQTRPLPIPTEDPSNNSDTENKIIGIDGAGPQQVQTQDDSIPVMRPAALLIASFDKDGTYTVSRDEFNAGLKAAFQRADVNKSNSLTPAEIETWRELALGDKDAPPASYAFDPNLDHTISMEEFTNAFERIFNRADENKDAQIAFEELMQMRAFPRRGQDRQRTRPRAQPNRPAGQTGQTRRRF